jgi:hypothetical protein
LQICHRRQKVRLGAITVHGTLSQSRMARRTLRSHMLSTDHIKQLLNDSSFTDEQIEEIRDACRVLAELMFEAMATRRFDAT